MLWRHSFGRIQLNKHEFMKTWDAVFLEQFNSTSAWFCKHTFSGNKWAQSYYISCLSNFDGKCRGAKEIDEWLQSPNLSAPERTRVGKISKVNDDPVEFEKWPTEVEEFRKITEHFKGIWRINLKLIKKNHRKMSTCNRLNLETLGSRLLMSKIIPDIGGKYRK